MEIDHINLMREMNRKILTHFKDHKDCDRIAEVTIAYLSQTIDECKYGSDGILVKLNKANVIKSVCPNCDGEAKSKYDGYCSLICQACGY